MDLLIKNRFFSKSIYLLIALAYLSTSAIAYYEGSKAYNDIASLKDSEIEALKTKLASLEDENKQGTALCLMNQILTGMVANDCTLAGEKLKESINSTDKHPNEVAAAITTLKKALDKTPIVSKMNEFSEKEKIQNLSKIVIWKEIPNYDVLPKNEQYTDFQSLYSQLSTAKISVGLKSEFETEEEYIKKHTDRLKENGLAEAMDNYVIFYAPLEWKFSAEKKHFSRKSPNFISLWKPEPKRKPSYIGQNSFGVAKEVSSEESEWGAVQFGQSLSSYNKYIYADEHEFDCKYSTEDNIFLPVSNDDNPKELSKQLYGLYVTKLRYPWIESDSSYSKPTLDNPVEISSSSKFIITDPRELWIVDNRNGKVLKKIKAQKCPKDKYGNKIY